MLVANRSALDTKFMTKKCGVIVIKGRNNSLLKTPNYGYSEISDAQWAAINEEYAHCAELKFKVIYPFKSINDMQSKYQDNAEIKTGDEGFKEKKSKKEDK